ncbi:ArsR/SmtB family transcription factor [Microbacterium sp. NPDC089695]|uniref:ArsR/SmtB family transcription factor n=1 Tax=Microbacterium sp. NPDC089695 TaxID=3364198 RepID=UPI003809033D
MRYLDEPEVIRAALSPVRRTLLAHLREPASASRLAEILDLPRQRVNYHLKELEKAGLVDLVEERRRRGFVERVFRARDEAVVVDPAVVGRAFADIQDHYAAERLVDVASQTVRDVARMQAAADEAGQRLLTFTIEADVRFAGPDAAHRFAEELADVVRRLATEHDTEGGRPYRLIAGGHPAPAPAKVPPSERTNEGDHDD